MRESLTINSIDFADYRKFKNTKAAFRAGARNLTSVMKSMIESGSGAKYGEHQASAPGDPPANLSGELKKSVNVKFARNGLKATIKPTAFYGRILQYGFNNHGTQVAPRPLADIVWQRYGDQVTNSIIKAIMEDAKYIKVKK